MNLETLIANYMLPFITSMIWKHKVLSGGNGQMSLRWLTHAMVDDLTKYGRLSEVHAKFGEIFEMDYNLDNIDSRDDFYDELASKLKWVILDEDILTGEIAISPEFSGVFSNISSEGNLNYTLIVK